MTEDDVKRRLCGFCVDIDAPDELEKFVGQLTDSRDIALMESVVGKDLFLTLIGANYSSVKEVEGVKEQLSDRFFEVFKISALDYGFRVVYDEILSGDMNLLQGFAWLFQHSIDHPLYSGFHTDDSWYPNYSELDWIRMFFSDYFGVAEKGASDTVPKF
jgi:hypothetical protein